VIANPDQPVRAVTGVLDLTTNTAVIRAMGYLPSADDVHVPMSIVRSCGLRRGDIISGVARRPAAQASWPG
jgi:transcription termination factor Rho